MIPTFRVDEQKLRGVMSSPKMTAKERQSQNWNLGLVDDRSCMQRKHAGQVREVDVTRFLFCLGC